MIGEVERVRFRFGESINKPIGGNIADKPFPQTLHGLAVSRGFDSQQSLARALGLTQGLVGGWYRGISSPSPELFGCLLIVLNLTDEEQEPLVELYAQELASQKLKRKNADFWFKKSRIMIHPSDNPLGKWFENQSEKDGDTLSQSSEKFKSPGLLLKRRRFSLEDLDFISQNGKDAYDLSEDEEVILLETVEKEKEYRREKGHRFQRGLIGMKVIEEQEKLNYPTWNGQQAGAELGITRERVRQLREKFGLPLLLTKVHMKKLKEYLAGTEDIREKCKPKKVA